MVMVVGMLVGDGGGPSAELSKDVGLVEKEDDAGVQKHFAICHHVEQLDIWMKIIPTWLGLGWVGG